MKAPYAKGSETSREAAESIEEHLQRLERIVYLAVVGAGPLGRTCDELEQELSMIHQTCSARVRALVLRGFIEDSGMTRNTRSNRRAVVYVKTAKQAPQEDPASPKRGKERGKGPRQAKGPSAGLPGALCKLQDACLEGVAGACLGGAVGPVLRTLANALDERAEVFPGGDWMDACGVDSQVSLGGQCIFTENVRSPISMGWGAVPYFVCSPICNLDAWPYVPRFGNCTREGRYLHLKTLNFGMSLCKK